MVDEQDLYILVVEDEPDGQEVITGILSYHAIRSNIVGSAEEALSSLKDNQYDGAIIDLFLPGMDGLRLLKEIRYNPDTLSLPCVAITAYHTSAVRQEAIKSGFDDYFPKPLDERKFATTVTKLLTNI